MFFSFKSEYEKIKGGHNFLQKVLSYEDFLGDSMICKRIQFFDKQRNEYRVRKWCASARRIFS